MEKKKLAMRKWLFILFIMLLVLTPIVELTRVVVLYGKEYGFEMAFIWEIIFYWVCYLSIIPLLHWELRRHEYKKIDGSKLHISDTDTIVTEEAVGNEGPNRE